MTLQKRYTAIKGRYFEPLLQAKRPKYTRSCITGKLGRSTAITALTIASSSLLVFGRVVVPAPVSAAPLPSNGSDSSHNVAYIYDDSLFPCNDPGSDCGMNDSGGDASIFANALGVNAPGSGNTGTYAPSGGSPVNLTNVSLSQLDGNPNALQGYDTAILYETCTIGASSNASAMSEINSFLSHGGKVMIFDADGCADSSKGVADWSHFMFPFATNSPGPQGATGSYNTVEPSSLTTGLSKGVQDGDSVGDANIFTTYDGSWYQSITATNTNNVSGIVEAYALAPSGGLAIYSGEDVWASDGATSHLTQVFNNMLNQRWNPANLPGDVSASGITLSPASQSVDHYASVHITATVKGASGKALKGIQVSFKTTRGHDMCDKTSRTTTDSSGKAVCNLTPATGMTDTVQASYTDSSSNVHTSNPATVNNTVVCPDYDFLGARGSGQTPLDSSNPKDYTSTDEYGMGGPQSVIYTVALDFMRSHLTKSISYYGIQYPAVPMPPTQGIKGFLNAAGAVTHAPTVGAYPASIGQGMRWTVSHIQWRDTYMGCHQTKYILAGYSQGAQVIADTLQAVHYPGINGYYEDYNSGADKAGILSLPSKLLSKISGSLPDYGEKYSSQVAGVVLFGDPKYNGFTYWRSPDSSEYSGGSLGLRRGGPEALDGDISSYCNTDDYICGLLTYSRLSGKYILNQGSINALIKSVNDKHFTSPHSMYLKDGKVQEAYDWLTKQINGSEHQ